MAFREVSDLSSDIEPIALGGFNKKLKKDNPTSVEGYYLGSRGVTTSKGPATLHYFQTPKGNQPVWGKTDSNRKLGSVPVGTMTKIWFDKMIESKNGTMYKYKVAVDDDNTIEVAGPAFAPAEDADDNVTASFATVEDADDEDAIQAAELAQLEKQAAQKARVQALLKKNKVG